MTISHHMPCKNKLDASNLFLHILRGLGFLGKNRSYLRTRTTTSIKILLANRCRLNHNYSGRDRHPQSHLCKTSCMSSVEQVSCARTCKVSPGRFIPLCHYDTKYTKVCNNMIINVHISVCSNRTKHLRIDTALIPLMGSLHRKQKFSYGCNTPRSNLGDTYNGFRGTHPWRPEAG